MNIKINNVVFFAKLTNTQRSYLDIIYTECDQNQTKNLANMGRNTFTPTSNECVSLS